MKLSRYFDLRVRRDRPEIELEYIERVLADPSEVEQQENGFFKMWGYIEEEEKWLRVISRADRETVENAFFDRTYRRRQR